MTHLIFHTWDTISNENRKKILVPVINMIRYNELSRLNKQILNGILEKCKQKEAELKTVNWSKQSN